MRITKTRLWLYAPVILIVALIGACGGEDSPAPAATSSGSGAPATNAPAVAGTLSSNDAAPVTPRAATPSATTATGTTAAAKLNLNTATGADYQAKIPNFPNNMVREFLEYKPYVSIRQFRSEIAKYVGAAQVTEWEKYVFVPVDPNKADAETLKQLPNLDDATAAKIIAARPFASNDAFLSKLQELAPGVNLATARAYLG